MKKFRTTKVCPRCSEKCDITDTKCPDCGLIFARLEFGSNKLAKKNILAKNKDHVVYTTTLPKDLKRRNLLLLCGFLGIFGAHNLYCGRYLKGIYMFFCGILTLACVTFTNYWFTDTLLYASSIPCGIMAFMWLFDFINLCLGKFKVPVSIDLTGETK